MGDEESSSDVLSTEKKVPAKQSFSSTTQARIIVEKSLEIDHLRRILAIISPDGRMVVEIERIISPHH